MTELIRDHTLLQFQSAITWKGGGCSKAWSFEDAGEIKKFFVFSAYAPKYCPACSIEDLSERGLSYWRRGHQIAGITSCLRHQMRLVEVNNPQAFARCPHYWHAVRTSNRPTKTEIAVEQLSEFEVRYSQICNLMMVADCSVSIQDVKTLLLGSAEKYQRIALSLLKNTIPENWFSRELSKLSGSNVINKLFEKVFHGSGKVKSEHVAIVFTAALDSWELLIPIFEIGKRGFGSEEI